MNAREKEIFMRGFEVGLRVAEDFETGLEQAEPKNREPIFKKAKKRTHSKREPWSPEQIEIIKDTSRSAADISKEIGRSVFAIYEKRKKLNVAKKINVDNGLAKLGQQ